jgi:antitoxin component HigA of HigAB toxin-antitoxin module
MSPQQKDQPITQALADLDALVQAHPELRAPEVQARLIAWLKEQVMTETKQMKQIFTRMPDELIEALDRLTERRQREQPWTTVTRSDVVRELLYQALGEKGEVETHP